MIIEWIKKNHLIIILIIALIFTYFYYEHALSIANQTIVEAESRVCEIITITEQPAQKLPGIIIP